MISKLKITARDFLVLAAICVTSTGLGYVFPFIPVLGLTENWIGDLRIALLTEEEQQDENIVIVSINEDTMEFLPYRSPIYRPFLAELVKRLDASGVKAIGIDILFDTPSEPELDAQLKEALRNVSSPVVVSFGDADNGLIPRQIQWMDDFLSGLPRVEAGYANLPKDEQDATVRTIFPGKQTAEGFKPGIAARLASHFGATPIERDVRLAYRGKPADQPHAFKIYPAQAIFEMPEQIRNAWLGGRIVMIGAVLTEIDLDLHRTPFAVLGHVGGEMPGVIVHAHGLSQMIEGRSLDEPSPAQRVALLVLFAVLGVLLARADIPLSARLTLQLFVVVGLAAAGFALYSEMRVLIPLVAPAVVFVLATWSANIYLGRQDREQKRFIKDAFSRYLSPAVVEQLVANPESLSLRGERRELTLMFTDVAGFTSMSEAVEPQVLVTALNQYLEGMCNIILKYGGTIDKFIGDAVFALFNAPVDLDDHAGKAVACAVELDQFSQAFRERKVAEGVPFGVTRIGVHTGDAIVGNIGSDIRFDYTALGDAVNSAARLESLNKQFGTRACVSGATASRVAGGVFKPMGSVIVKGKTEPIDIFMPMPRESAQDPLFKRYVAAYGKMSAGDASAIDDFRALAADAPDDPLVRLHLSRLERGEITARFALTEK